MAPWYAQIPLAIGFFGPPLLALMHAVRRPAGDWNAISRSKRFWIAFIAVSSPLGLGPLAALLYVVFVPRAVVVDPPIERASAR